MTTKKALMGDDDLIYMYFLKTHEPVYWVYMSNLALLKLPEAIKLMLFMSYASFFASIHKLTQ